MVIIRGDIIGTITRGSLTTMAGTGIGITVTPVPLG